MLRLLLSAGLALLMPSLQAQLLFQEGRDYHELIETIDQGSKPKVVEFFWYGCPHCYNAEPGVHQWLQSKPEDIQFERVPAMPSERWRMGGVAYYVIEALGVDAHQRIFDEVHQKKNTMIIFKEERLQAFLEKEFGVKKEDFEKALNSFAVQQKLKRAEDLFNRSKLSGVPSFVVNGKYFVPIKDKSDAQYFDMLSQMSRSLP